MFDEDDVPDDAEWLAAQEDAEERRLEEQHQAELLALHRAGRI